MDKLKSLIQVFARYKGPFPIGSFIRVDDEVVLVVGSLHVEQASKDPWWLDCQASKS